MREAPAHKTKLVTLAKVADPRAPIVYGIVQPGPDVPNGVIFIQSRDVGGQLSFNALNRTSVEIAAQYRRSRISPGDILFSLRGKIGQSSLVPPELQGANIARGVARIRVTKEHDPEYVRYVLQGPDLQALIAKNANGSTFREISIDALRKLPIPALPLPEQRKIAEILRTWDAAIEKAERRLIATKVIRAAEIARAISKQENCKRSALGALVQPVTSKVNDQSIPILTISAESGFVEQQTYFARRIASESLHSYSMLERGEFAYNRSRANGYPYGAIKRLNIVDRGAVTSLYFCFRCDSNDPDIADYLEVLFENGVLNPQLARIAKEGSRAHGLLNVGKEDFLRMIVHIPSQRTRVTIVAMHRHAIVEISAAARRVQLLNKQKSGLMQRLLTGQVRVPEAAIYLSPSAD